MNADKQPSLCPRDHTCPSLGTAHDTPSGYRQGCRSEAAVATNAAYASAYRALTANRNQPSRVDGLGTSRRLRALTALGWTTEHLARRLGCRSRRVSHIRAQHYPTVTARTARNVSAVYEELSMKLGPSDRARQKAAQLGWAPPLCWDDIDDPTERPKYGERRTAAERVDHSDDIARRTRAGQSAAEIARDLGISMRTVVRHRSNPDSANPERGAA